MKKIFDGNGILNETGKNLLLDFNTALDNLMSSDEVYDMSESEIRTLGSVLAKILGDRISHRIANKVKTTSKLDKMTDEEFEKYLLDKYGSNWHFLSLSPEEYARVPTLDFDKIFDDMKNVGNSIMQYLNCNGVRLK
jgi:hypothetical protein